MEVKPEILQVLHRILRQKTDLDGQLVGGPRRVQHCRNVEAEATKHLEKAQQELKRLKLIAADKQLQLKMRETKLEDFKAKRNASYKINGVFPAFGVLINMRKEEVV